MVPVLAHTQNEGLPFCCSRRPAPAAASGTQDPRLLPLDPGGAGRMGGTDSRHACPLFATCRVPGLRGGKRVRNKPCMLCGFLQLRARGRSWRAAGRWHCSPPRQSQGLDLPKSTLHGYPPLLTPGQASWNPAKACVPLEAGVSLTAPVGQYVTRQTFGKCQPAAPTSGGFQDRIRQSTARCREARGSCCTASYGRRRGRIVAGRVFPDLPGQPPPAVSPSRTCF